MPIDHFKCYKVKVPKGIKRFQRRTVTLADQFEDKEFVVTKPTKLCTPVDKNGEGFVNPKGKDGQHLMCYKVKPASGEAKHAKRTGVHVNNQFGPEQLDTIKEEELCVPSKKTLP